MLLRTCSPIPSGHNFRHQVEAATELIIRRWSRTPQVGIVLGTGLGHFVDAVHVDEKIAYCDIPFFPVSTAIGHAGHLICGTLEGTPVVVLQGRCHAYEGYSMDEITFPVRVLHELGVQRLLLSCAAGGLSDFQVIGDLMAISDHLNMLFQPVYGAASISAKQDQIYDSQFTDQLMQIARRHRIPMAPGTYIAVPGPNYETRAELRFLRNLGDAVGMSTVPEATVARSLGMRVCGIATITNLCNPDVSVVADGQHVIDVAAHAEPRFRTVVSAFVRSLAPPPTSLFSGSRRKSSTLRPS